MRGTCVCDVYVNIRINNCSAQKTLSLFRKKPSPFHLGIESLTPSDFCCGSSGFKTLPLKRFRESTRRHKETREKHQSFQTQWENLGLIIKKYTQSVPIDVACEECEDEYVVVLLLTFWISQKAGSCKTETLRTRDVHNRPLLSLVLLNHLTCQMDILHVHLLLVVAGQHLPIHYYSSVGELRF